MGAANKRQNSNHTNHHDNPNRARHTVIRRQHSQQKSIPTKSRAPNNSHQQGASQSHKKNDLPQQRRLQVPFTGADRVLLVGEGDFSFTNSLALYHKVRSIVATCFDTQLVLSGKYPNAQKTIRKITAKVTRQAHATTDVTDDSIESNIAELEWNGFSSDSDEEKSDEDVGQSHQKKHCEVAVIHGIDATKLSTTHKKALRPYSPFTKIVFNFPHVGGLSTDVNRQVRANQQLLVGFFNAAKSLLATPSNPVKHRPRPDRSDEYNSEYESEEEGTDVTDGQILVTLFEGEPYTLWNIRDLARHSGLKVVESFKFPWSAYPGYKHARTTGDITVGKDRSDEGKRKGAWRGEERDARCYVLALTEPEGGQMRNGSAKRRKKDNGDSDSD